MFLRALVSALLLTVSACARTAVPLAPPAAAAKPFSMRVYYMAFLRRGPRWSAERTPEVRKLLEGHMANIRRLGAERKLLIAGPFELEDSAPRDAIVGMFLFDVPTKGEAEALVRTDPTIAAGHFAAEVVPWYGPSGLTYDGREEELRKAASDGAGH